MSALRHGARRIVPGSRHDLVIRPDELRGDVRI